MTDIEKINLLIAAQTSENNFLAMRLMLDVLRLSFEEAFLRLQWRDMSATEIHLEIADIQIVFYLNIYHIIDVPPISGYLYRRIFVSEKLLKQWNQDVYIDEDTAWHFENNSNEHLRDNILQQADIIAVSNIIKGLFFERYG